MKTKKFGNCEFWDKENLEQFDSYAVAKCLYVITPLPESLITNGIKVQVADCKGNSCQVYKERKDAE